MKKKETFCPGCHTWDKRAPPFVPDRRFRLGNRDNSGFPTGTNQRFCSSVPTSRAGPYLLMRHRPITTTKMLMCPGWETAVVPVFQPGTPVRNKRAPHFVPGLATGTKEDILSRLVTPTGTKGAASAHVAGAPFCPGWCYQRGQKVSFFSCFSFLNSFSISIILLHFN